MSEYSVASSPVVMVTVLRPSAWTTVFVTVRVVPLVVVDTVVTSPNGESAFPCCGRRSTRVFSLGFGKAPPALLLPLQQQHQERIATTTMIVKMKTKPIIVSVAEVSEEDWPPDPVVELLPLNLREEIAVVCPSIAEQRIPGQTSCQIHSKRPSTSS